MKLFENEAPEEISSQSAEALSRMLERDSRRYPRDFEREQNL